MKGTVILTAALVVSVAQGQAVVGTGSTGNGSRSPFNKLYDRSSEQVIVGKVTGKGMWRPDPTMAESMTVLVQTKGGKTVTVELGPRWFVANQNAHVNVNDQVKIIGSGITWHGGPVLLAKQIVNRKSGKVLAVRDIEGAPYWVARREKSTSPPPSNAIDGTIVSTNTVNVNGVPYAGFVMQTPKGNINILTAPTWYMNGQDAAYQVGDHAQVVAGPTPLNAGNGVFLADTIFSNGYTMTLQNNGFPVWYGYGGGN